ncbi:hypothetical protein Tco_0873838 [Tanacetum coccineum]|uniref:Uncharacterized protein n=1 Tax=Tanacetum coccineum TaxID=301880 RepID=A0ABQ5BMW3_9ASTR
MTHPHPNRRFVPQAVLTRSGKINTAGASVNTVRVKDTTARNRAVVNENKEKEVNVVKASTCWVWKAKNSSESNTFKKYSYIDARGRSKSIIAWIPKRVQFSYFMCRATHSRRSTKKKELLTVATIAEGVVKKKQFIDSGCSRNITGNKCYLTEYEDYDKDVEERFNMNNVASSYTVPDGHSTKFLKDHPQDQVIGSLKIPVQTRKMNKINKEHGLISLVHKLRRTNPQDFQNCLFACFLSQMEPKKPVQALKDPSWVEAMQDELL